MPERWNTIGIARPSRASLIVVTGSRSWTDQETIRRALRAVRNPQIAQTVLHGGAKGADRIAASIAKHLGFAVDVDPVKREEWSTLGKRAGLLRNDRMLDRSPDGVLAFWDGISSGTKYTIDGAKARGLPVRVFTAR